MTSEVERVLAEHGSYYMTAGWNGSPDPEKWRNIRPTCHCGEQLPPGPATLKESHRAHVAEALAPVIRKAQADALRGAATAVDAMSLLDDPSDPVYIHVGAKWLRDRADALDQGGEG